jgi:hypothetical protein
LQPVRRFQVFGKGQDTAVVVLVVRMDVAPEPDSLPSPTVATIIVLADALNVSLGELFTRAESGC